MADADPSSSWSSGPTPTRPMRGRKSPTTAGADPYRGRRLGKYILDTRLGAGGMGLVYAAEDTALQRTVALKLLQEPLAAHPDARQRFEREARAIARLNHPNVVAIHDIGHEGDLYYLAMELLPGGNAGDHLHRSESRDWREATRMIADACRGLIAVHDAGLVHRDLKPSNLLRTADGTVKVGDFGLVKGTDGGGGHLTGSDSILGTPDYMSPEQCRREDLDARSDLYSLGATYYTLLTGRPPFAGAAPMLIMFAHCSAPVPDPTKARPEVPAECAAVIRRAMAKRRADRYADARAMLADLEALLQSGPVRAIPSAPIEPPPAPPSVVRDAPRPAGNRGTPRALWYVVLSAALLVLLFGMGAGIRSWTRRGTGAREGRAANVAKPIVAGLPRLNWRETLAGHAGAVRTVRFSPDGALLASAGADRTVRVWDIGAGKERWTGRGHGAAVRTVAFAPDGRTVASGSEDRSIRFWNAADGAKLGRLEGQEQISDLGYAPDGRQLAAAVGYSGLVVWNSDGRAGATERIRVPADKENEMVHAIAFAPDGASLAEFGFNKRVRLLETDKYQELDRLSENTSVMGGAFSPDGAGVALACSQGKLLFWKPRTRETPATLLAIPDSIACAAFSKDGGSIFCVGHSDGRILIVNRATLEKQETRGARDGSLRWVALSPDGKTLATSGHPSGEIDLWDVDSGAAD